MSYMEMFEISKSSRNMSKSPGCVRLMRANACTCECASSGTFNCVPLCHHANLKNKKLV